MILMIREQKRVKKKRYNMCTKRTLSCAKKQGTKQESMLRARKVINRSNVVT